jgi:hypothetical protein
MPPESEKNKIWTETSMMEFIRERTLPKLRHHRTRFPSEALMLFGKTTNPRDRDGVYHNFAAVFRRHEITPFMDINEQILFKCWSDYDSLLFEFLMQYNTIDENGEFFTEFGSTVNKQTYHRPIPSEKSTLKLKAHYVYIKMTRKPWTTAQEIVNMNAKASKQLKRPLSPVDDIEDTKSQVSSKLSFSSLPSLTSDSDEDDREPRCSGTAVIPKKKLRVVYSSSSCDD